MIVETIQPKPPLAEFGSSLKTALPKGEKEKAMNKQEFIKKIQELREDGEHDLRTVIYFAEQLDEPSREECEMIPHNVATKKGMVLHGRKCTNCEKWFRGCSIIHKSDKANYCPNCGAKIKRGEER